MIVDQDPRIDNADNVSDVDTNEDDQVSNGWIRRCQASWRVAVLMSALVASVGLAIGLFFVQYRPDQQVDDAVADAAIKAASEGAVAVLTYSPDTVDHDLAVAYPHLTGEFLRYYRDFGQHFVAPGVREQKVKASATVLRSAASQLHPDSAVVLLFIHQTTQSKDKPEPVLTSNGVRVTLTKVDGSWLISKFEPT